MGWLITGGILLLLAVLPLGVRIRYDSQGLRIKVIVGFAALTVYPMRRKKPKEEKKTEAKPVSETVPENLPKPPQPPKAAKTKEDKKQQGGSLTDFLPLVKLALELLGDFRRRLRIDDLYLRLILAGGDPCDLALNYGRVWAALGNLMPQLDRLFVIKKRDVEAECDFTASETKVFARADMTITLGRLFSLAAVYGVRALREFLNIQKKRKGGAAL